MNWPGVWLLVRVLLTVAFLIAFLWLVATVGLEAYGRTARGKRRQDEERELQRRRTKPTEQQIQDEIDEYDRLHR